MKTGLIYIWYDKKHKRFYLGCHWGKEDDGYICSSRWMRKAYRRRPQDFKRRIIQRGIEKKLLRDVEHQWLQLIPKEELGKKYYNLRTHNWGCNEYSEESRLKISKALRGKPKPWLKGKMLSEERRAKMRKPKPPRTEEHKRKLAEGRRGKTHTEEALQKIREARARQTMKSREPLFSK